MHMKEHIITSIDLGSSVARCVIADVAQEDGQIRILGVGIVPAEGDCRCGGKGGKYEW